jgi:hypothetical protein
MAFTFLLALLLIPPVKGGKRFEKPFCESLARRPPLNLAYLDRTKDIRRIFSGTGVDNFFLGMILFIVNIR